jgi:S-DNA-T family DNA segregation ATPase FtsK/SpoIIIE
MAKLPSLRRLFLSFALLWHLSCTENSIEIANGCAILRTRFRLIKGGILAQKRRPSPAKGRSSMKKTVRKSASIRKGLQNLSPERKLDIWGISLTVLGLLLMISFLTSQEGNITGAIVLLLYRIAGYGAFLFPVVCLMIGVWLIFRNEDRLPMISTGKLVGIILLFFNLLTWIHLLTGGGWDLAKAGGGGGYIGALFERAIVRAVGQVGTFVVLIGWLLMAVALTIDTAIPDLLRGLKGAVSKTGRQVAAQTSQITQKVTAPKVAAPRVEPKKEVERTPVDLDGFTPISEVQQANRPVLKKKKGSEDEHPQTEQSKKPQDAQEGSSLRAGLRDEPLHPAWKLPQIADILNAASKNESDGTIDKERAKIIEETLLSFDAPGHVVEIHRGPTFTQFGVEPDLVQTRNGNSRVRVSKITALSDDLALALATQRIRIQAPVPGKHYIGIEVPNSEASLVTLREGMESTAFQKLNSSLKLMLGENVAGKPVAVDLRDMPHLLIAGTTGSGKSVCINAIISCLLMQRTPEEMRMVMIDPKRVELTGYNNIPHLLTPVIVDSEKVIGTLRWISREMDARFHKFAEVGARNIQDYNNTQPSKLPYIVVIVDELQHLMTIAPDETERSFTRLSQMARATGIHLIIATQRPSVNVITGVIKANFPARIAFAVVSGVDSRVILDQVGAERLMGKGDMLFQAPNEPSPKRLQGVYLSEEEIQRLVHFWRRQAEELKAAAPTPQVTQSMQKVFPVGETVTEVPLFDSPEAMDEDPLLKQVIAYVRQEERASVSMLQRKFSIGYNRAARLVDRMEELEIIGKPDSGSGVRPVLDFGDEEKSE